MRKTCIALQWIILISVISAFGQDLNRLQSRAKALIALSVAGNKAQAASYVEPAKRDQYLAADTIRMAEGRFVGLEFTDDPKLVYATYVVTLILPEVGRMNATPRVPWVWTGKDWFVRIDNAEPVFNQSLKPAVLREDLPFELTSKVIDFGKHTQGEILKQTLNFRADKERTELVLPKTDVPGLLVSSPVWISNESGHVDLTLDTTLWTKDGNFKLDFEATGFEQEKTRAEVELKAQIEPRLLFSQIPEIVDVTKSGAVDVIIENVSQIPLTPTSIQTSHPQFKIESDVPKSIAPGETLKMHVVYEAQPEPVAASIYFRTAQPVLAAPGFQIPIHVKLSANVPASIILAHPDR
jgi:hypothetical protein